MKLSTRVINAFSAFSGENKTKNSIQNEATDFLRYGNRNKPLLQDWSQVEMSDQDMYTGYSYAAINKRANRASVLGKRFLYTEATKAIMEAAKKKEIEVVHPYLKVIEDSKDFTQKKFWHDISTYLDLEGVYYLMAVRAVKTNTGGETTVGAIQKFVMLNPYQIRRVRKEADNTIGGYIESRDGVYREIPKEMIIEIRLLNPFDNDLAFSMTDAAKESQYTIKQAGDYTRHSIKGNINAPGAITTDVVLEDNIFDNFVSRISNHGKGEPLYGNGAGAIKWESMQIDLDKASLDKINEIHRSTLFAVAGVSKTSMGIETSGTGREVSKTQKDDFTENAVMPQIEDIIDALNLDYRKFYPEWEKEKYEILLDNPLESDRDAELKDIDIRTKEFEMADKLKSIGYEHDTAAKYAHGDIGIIELGDPTLEPLITDQAAIDAAAAQLGIAPAPVDPNAPVDVSAPRQTAGVANHFLVENAGKGYNPYRDTKGRFDDGITLSTTPGVGTGQFVPKGTNKKKIEAAVKAAKAAARAKSAVDRAVAATEAESHKPLLADKSTNAEISLLADKYYPKSGKLPEATVKNGDVLMKKIYADNGFNGLPVSANAADYKTATDAYPELIRGVPKMSHVKDFMLGKTHRPGAGYYGSGTYFAMDKSQAGSYGNNVFKAALSPKTKIVKSEKLHTEMRKFLKAHNNSPAAIKLTSNDGRFAAMRGYDAIQVLNDNSVKAFQQVVVLNRSMVLLPGGK